RVPRARKVAGATIAGIGRADGTELARIKTASRGSECLPGHQEAERRQENNPRDSVHIQFSLHLFMLLPLPVTVSPVRCGSRLTLPSFSVFAQDRQSVGKNR